MNSINRDKLYNAKNAHYELGKLLYEFEELAQSHWDLEQALKLADQQLSEAKNETKDLGRDVRYLLHQAHMPGRPSKDWTIKALHSLEKRVSKVEEALGLRKKQRVYLQGTEVPPPPEDEFALAK